MSALRTIATGQVTYQSLYLSYAPDLKSLGPPRPGAKPSASAADLIDQYLANGSRNGYRFIYTPLDFNGDGIIDGYFVSAEPENGGMGGHYYLDNSAMIRYEQVHGREDNSKPGAVGGKKP